MEAPEEKPERIDFDEFLKEIRGIRAGEPGNNGEPEVCPGCGQIHDPDDDETEHPEIIKALLKGVKTATGKTLEGVNVIDVARDAAGMLNNPSIPVDHKIPMIASFMGTFSENIDKATWEQILASQPVPCGSEGCDCHLVMAQFLPALHDLKLAAIRNSRKEEE
jgi:hypothetical protein